MNFFKLDLKIIPIVVISDTTTLLLRWTIWGILLILLQMIF